MISLLFSFYNSPVWLNDQRPVVFVVVAQLQFLITCYHAKLLFLDRKTRQSDDKSKEADVRLIKAEERLRKASIEAAAYVPVIYSSICSSKNLILNSDTFFSCGCTVNHKLQPSRGIGIEDLSWEGKFIIFAIYAILLSMWLHANVHMLRRHVHRRKQARPTTRWPKQRRACALPRPRWPLLRSCMKIH